MTGLDLPSLKKWLITQLSVGQSTSSLFTWVSTHSFTHHPTGGKRNIPRKKCKTRAAQSGGTDSTYLQGTWKKSCCLVSSGLAFSFVWATPCEKEEPAVALSQFCCLLVVLVRLPEWVPPHQQVIGQNKAHLYLLPRRLPAFCFMQERKSTSDAGDRSSNSHICGPSTSGKILH